MTKKFSKENSPSTTDLNKTKSVNAEIKESPNINNQSLSLNGFFEKERNGSIDKSDKPNKGSINQQVQNTDKCEPILLNFDNAESNNIKNKRLQLEPDVIKHGSKLNGRANSSSSINASENKAKHQKIAEIKNTDNGISSTNDSYKVQAIESTQQNPNILLIESQTLKKREQKDREKEEEDRQEQLNTPPTQNNSESTLSLKESEELRILLRKQKRNRNRNRRRQRQNERQFKNSLKA